MTKWEYALESVSHGSDVIGILNKWGENGWEAWGMREGGYRAGIVVTVYLRRPAQPKVMAPQPVEIVRLGVHCDRCNRPLGEDEADPSKMKTAHRDAWGVLGFGCPVCSWGASEDWENVAPLRCTGCHRPLLIPPMKLTEKP